MAPQASSSGHVGTGGPLPAWHDVRVLAWPRALRHGRHGQPRTIRGVYGHPGHIRSCEATAEPTRVTPARYSSPGGA